MNLWSRWKALLARKETGEAQAAFRITVGIGAFWAITVPLQHDAWRLLWTNAGYLTDAPDPQTVGWAILGGAISAACLILGFGGRITAFITLQFCLYLFNINPTDGGAHDRYINNGLWLLVLSDNSASWSLDCRLREGQWRSERKISAWPRYVAVFQLVLTYWATGVQKVSVEWTPLDGFSALWYIVRSPLYMRVGADWMPYWFTQFATAGTWLWEWGGPVWLFAFWARDNRGPEYWSNRYDLRTLWALWGLAMHGTLFILTVLGPLQWATIAWYAALYHSDEYRALADRLRRWTGRGGSGGAGPPPEDAEQRSESEQS